MRRAHRGGDGRAVKSREKRRRRQLRKLHKAERRRASVDLHNLWERMRQSLVDWSQKAEAGRSL